MAVKFKTTNEAVADGARAIEGAENRIRGAARAMRRLADDIDFMSKSRVSGFGAIDSARMRFEAESIAGDLATAGARIAVLHRELTDRCIAAGVDLPQPKTGGDR